MKRIRLLLAVALAFAFCSALVGCGGMSGTVKDHAKAAVKSIATARKTVKSEKAKYLKRTKAQDFAFYKPYADKEKWINRFDQANKALDAADQTAKQVNALVDENNGDRENELLDQIATLKQSVSSALGLAKYPVERMKFLVTVKKTAPAMVEKARTELAEEAAIFNALHLTVDKAESDFPQKKADIDKRFSPFEQANNLCETGYDNALTEYKSSTADYAKLGDGCTTITTQLGWIKNNDQTLRSKLAELNRSYSKTLIDMRIEYYVTVGRTSWCECDDDWPTETEHTWTRQVDQATYDYFDNLFPDTDDDSLLADYSDGWFGGENFDVKVDQGQWDKLNISYKEEWPDGDNSAEYWLSDCSTKCYHKYKIVENGVTTTTNWELVDDQYFEDHWDDLGMELVCKPYGCFEEETVKTASPPGMACVGNSRYGHWQQDSGGNFWVWYGQYRFIGDMLGGNRYYYNDWNDWNHNYRGRQPYYGYDKKTDECRYGSGSSHVQTTYSRSSWSRHGGFKEEDSSVRDAGPRGRAGGPGGGGK